ncbi:MAG: hypothetical protein A2Y69_09635 [Candidatus Aminicenantes bacterium RBG_13_59_9]|nr:MAG: hypothetical protein A2Y69_09635 [Candidatus Aminicenantes bacterium RBG_13_59_9]
MDYLFALLDENEVRRRALPSEILRSTSFCSSLCTFFDDYRIIKAWLRITMAGNKIAAVGFPDFTRFFNHDFS